MSAVAALDWGRDGGDWPLREACRTVEAGGLRWLVLDQGEGPVCLMLHGTGAATHSWRGLAPLLARRMRVIAPDLPGHGFTDRPSAGGSTLPGMARAVADLLATLGVAPALAVGHSAGAAILCRMALDGLVTPKLIVSLNGAFVGFSGPVGQFFSPLAKLLVVNPLVPHLFAWHAGDSRVVSRLLDETGSRLDSHGVELYRRLAGTPGHVAGALAMMASWDLAPLEREMPRLPVPLLLVAATGDRTVPPGQAYALKARMPQAGLVRLRGLGHLAHEEDPAAVADLILGRAEAAGILSPEQG